MSLKNLHLCCALLLSLSSSNLPLCSYHDRIGTVLSHRNSKTNTVAISGTNCFGVAVTKIQKWMTMAQTDATSITSAVPAAPIRRPALCIVSAFNP